MLLDDLKEEADDVVRTYMTWYTSPLSTPERREIDETHFRACLFHSVQARYDNENPAGLQRVIDSLTTTINLRIEQKLKRNL